MDTPSWEVGAPGQWVLDLSHTPPGTTRIVQTVMVESMPKGMRRMFADLGAPVETLDVRYVNGFMYTRLRPLIGGDKPMTRVPPKLLLKLASRVHPLMRERATTAARTQRESPWLQVIADWQSSGRDKVQRANLQLQDVELSTLTDADTAVHAAACIAHTIHHWELHFWLHGFDLGPLGQYLYECGEWGLGASDLLPLLEGASPSTSEPNRLLVRIRQDIEAASASPTSLDQVRAVSPGVSTALDEYLRSRGSLLFSRYDIDGFTLRERPDLVLSSILSAVPHDTSATVATAIAAVREQVPAEHRERFDVVLAEARAAMDLRDDNGPNTAEWPLGLTRLALLELGRRLVAAGLAHRPEDAFELERDEVAPSLFTSRRPTAEELAARAEQRRRQADLQAPRLIGPPEPQPHLDTLPPTLARLVGMVQLVMAQMGLGPEQLARASGLHGTGVGVTAARGRARVATSPEAALDVLEPGDILVVPCTTPAYNLVLSIAGGVITAEGGPLSHAAVLARELGIPAVVGAADALTAIPDGALVEVDPVAGEVRVLSVV